MKIASNLEKVISGYEDDRYLLGEGGNDCTVVSLAAAFKMSYTAAHMMAGNYGRKTGRGMLTAYFKNMYKDLERKGRVRALTGEEITTYYPSTGKVRKNKLSTFITNNPIGTFVLLVRGHAITIEDGVILQGFSPTNQYVKMGWKVVEE
jgi:hypothetical protein